MRPLLAALAAAAAASATRPQRDRRERRHTRREALRGDHKYTRPRLQPNPPHASSRRQCLPVVAVIPRQPHVAQHGPHLAQAATSRRWQEPSKARKGAPSPNQTALHPHRAEPSDAKSNCGPTSMLHSPRQSHTQTCAATPTRHNGPTAAHPALARSNT